MNPNRKSSSSSCCSLKSRFIRAFLRALIRINRQRRVRGRPTHNMMFRRYRRVKIAADKSMALAVGSNRAWSRAMLWKIQRRHKAWRHHHHRAASASASSAVVIRSRNYINNRRRNNFLKEKGKRKKSYSREQEEEEVGATELRKLVPGGEAMDLCSLLDETAHYIKCLVTQVQVMRDIDHQLYSNI